MTTRNPSLHPLIFHPLIAKLLQSQQQHSFFSLAENAQTTVVVVGVSGGADSVCLLHLLHQLRHKWQLDLHVAHFDHAVRADSATDCEFVRQLADQLELPFHFERRIAQSTALEKISEAALRTARLTFLHTLACKIVPAGQLPTLALAHHADDQAETIIFRLTRGAGNQGMRGMLPVTKMFVAQFNEYVRIIRPLLDVRQSEIVRYLHDHKLSWRDDPSNQALDYARNRIRQRVLPELTQINPQAVAAIVRTALLLAESAERLERIDRQLLESLGVGRPAIGGVAIQRYVLDLAQFHKLDQAEQRAVLRLAIRELLPEQASWGATNFAQIAALCQQIQQQHSASQPRPLFANLAWSVLAAQHALPLRLSLHHIAAVPWAVDHPQLPSNFLAQAIRVGETIQVEGWSLQSVAIARQQLPADWQQNDNPWQAWLDMDQVAMASLDCWEVGMKVATLGMNGQSKSLGDFFTDRKIHPAERKNWPLVVDKANGAVLWVCGLAIAHSVRITESTKRVLGLLWKPSL